MFATNFTALDWVIIFLYLIAIALAGMYVNRHVHVAADYLVGGRSAGTALSVASFIGTGLGLVTVVYATMEGVTKGFSYLSIAFLDLAAAFLLGTTGFVIARLRRMNLTTITEYFERRYSKVVRVTGGILCAVAGILNMGLFPKMGALFITYAAGWGGAENSDLLINLITTFLIILVLIYTVSGGMVAIIITDYVQFVLLTGGLGMGLWLVLSQGDLSWDHMVTTMSNRYGEAAFNPFHENSYGLTYIIWTAFVVFTAALCWAPEASRALTTEDEATTKRTFYLGSSGFFARLALPVLWGVAAITYMSNHQELAEFFSEANLGEEANSNRIIAAVPLMMGKLLPTGLLGILMAGLMAAHMSVHDSYFMAWATVISQDVVAPLRRQPMTDEQNIMVTRVCIVAIAIFLLIWGVWYPLPDSVWTYMAITGTIYLSGAATTLVGGMYWRRASTVGAMLALLGGLFAVFALKPVRDVVLSLFRDSSFFETLDLWYTDRSVGLATFLGCIVLFVIGSLLFPDRNNRFESAEIN
jgi:SSS family solute:Na+ symporter